MIIIGDFNSCVGYDIIPWIKQQFNEETKNDRLVLGKIRLSVKCLMKTEPKYENKYNTELHIGETIRDLYQRRLANRIQFNDIKSEDNINTR